VNTELKMIWKEAVVAKFEDEGDNKEPQWRLKRRTYRARSSSTNQWIANSVSTSDRLGQFGAIPIFVQTEI
jgi:hypothetical protein